MKNFTRWLVQRVIMPTSGGHSHLVWPFSPCVHLAWPLPTLCGHSHLASTLCNHLPPCVGILTSCDHSHLVSTSRDHFPAYVGIPTLHEHSHLTSTSYDHFSPRVGILTSHSPFMTSHDHSHLAWVFSPCVIILTLCPPCMTISRLVWAFSPHVTIPTLCDHFPLHNLAISHGCKLGMAMWDDFAKVYKGKFLEIFIICTLDIAEVTSTQSNLMSMRDNFFISCGFKVAKLSLMDASWQSCLALMRCDFANLTTHGHSHLTSTSCCVSSCPLHHAKVTLHDLSHIVWPYSSHIHLALCVKLPPPPCKSHLVWPFSPCVAILISSPPHIVCWVVPSIMQKSPHMTILTSCGHSQSHVHLMSPLHAKIISFTLRGEIPKKVTQQPQFHQ